MVSVFVCHYFSSELYLVAVEFVFSYVVIDGVMSHSVFAVFVSTVTWFFMQRTLRR